MKNKTNPNALSENADFYISSEGTEISNPDKTTNPDCWWDSAADGSVDGSLTITLGQW